MDDVQIFKKKIGVNYFNLIKKILNIIVNNIVKK